MRWLLVSVLWLVVPYAVNAATLYLDGTLGADCTSGNYSIASRNCTGSDGNAYNTVQEAMDNSAANDTIEVRTGTYVLNVSTTGIVVKNGQTWQARTGESVTLDATGELRAFHCLNAPGTSNVTIDGFTILGGTNNAIALNNCGTGFLIQNNDISGWHSNDAPSNQAIAIRVMADWTVRNNFIHDPIPGTFGMSCIASSSQPTAGANNGGIVERNHVRDCTTGIRTDVDDGIVTPHIWRYNYVEDNSDYGFSLEARSKAVARRNIIVNAGEAVRIRPGGNMSDIEVTHNTSYQWNDQGIRVNQTSATNQSLTSSLVRDNVWFSNDNNEVFLIEEIGTDASNEWSYNLFHVTHANNRAICWNEPWDNAGFSCNVDVDTTRYLATVGDLAQFTTDTGEGIGQIVGDPLFISAPTNFNLGAGSPAINAANDGIDLGVFEPPLFFSGATVDVDTWQLIFTSLFSPIQVASACTGITPKEDGNTCIASNCAVSGGVMLTFDVSGACVGLNAADVLTVDLAQGAIEDSIEVGGTLGDGPFNGENLAVTGLSVTNGLGGGATFCNLDQIAFGIRRWGVVGEGFATPRELIRRKGAGQDVNVPPGSKLQVRASILCDDPDGTDGSDTFALRPYACDGTCGTPANWYQLTSTFGGNLARLATDPTVASPGITTEQLDCGTFTEGVNIDANLGTFPTRQLADGECVEDRAIIEIDTAAVAGTDIILVNFQESDGTDLNSSVDATVYIGAPWAER